jgi:hypothetical protein
MYQEAFFNAYAAGDTPDGEAACQAVFAADADNQPFEYLDALFASFADFLVHAHRITGPDIDDGFLILFIRYFAGNTFHKSNKFYTKLTP